MAYGEEEDIDDLDSADIPAPQRPGAGALTTVPNIPAGAQMPNMARNPDDPREKMRAMLETKYGQPDKMLSPEMRAADRAPREALESNNSDLALMRLINQSANQAGTLHGKAASSAPADQYTNSLIQGNQQELAGMMADRKAQQDAEERRVKMMQYLADKQRQEARDAQQMHFQNESLRLRDEANKAQNAFNQKKLEAEHPTDGAAAQGMTSAGKPMSEGMLKAQADLERMQSSAKNIDDLMNREGFDTGKIGDVATRANIWRDLSSLPLIGGLAGGIGEYGAQGALSQLSPDERQYYNEVQNFIAGKLRKESGASISASEYKREYERYFPMPGDDAQTIEAKRQARNREILGRRTETGRFDQHVYGENDQMPGDVTKQATTAPKSKSDQVKDYLTKKRS